MGSRSREEPFAPPRANTRRPGDFAPPASPADVARHLEGRGFTVLVGDDDEVRAIRTRFHGELLTGIDTVVWLRRVDTVGLDTIETDEERLADWGAEALPGRRLRSRMTVLAYLARTSSPEARDRVARGPRMGSGRFRGVGIRDDDGVHAFSGVRLVGWAFFPLLNFLVRSTLAPTSEPEPRVTWVWSVIVGTGLLPIALTLAAIASILARARGWWVPW